MPHDTGGYFDFSSFDEAVVVRTALMDALDAMGLEVEVGHHEVALGQHEIDFRFGDALTTADNVLTLKYTVKAIAAQHGLVASFMPKPVFGINGSGMHCHQSMFDKKTGENLFFDANDEAHLSKTAYSFIAGQLAHARALAAVVAPTVNSYKRLVPGYEAPVYIGWAQQNRSALIRIPRYTEGRDKAVRAELRFPDPSANPYLAFTVMLAAALDGIEKDSSPPKPLNNINLYHLDAKERRKLGVKELPGSLAEALTELEKDTLLTAALGEMTYEAFMRAKWEEWDQYRLRVSDYEIEKIFGDRVRCWKVKAVICTVIEGIGNWSLTSEEIVLRRSYQYKNKVDMKSGAYRASIFCWMILLSIAFVSCTSKLNRNHSTCFLHRK